MKNLKYIILIVLVIIIIIIIALLLFMNSQTKEELSKQQNDYLEELNNPGYSIIGLKPELIKLNNTYFSVDACIEKIMSYSRENNAEAVYNLLNQEYIDKNGITKNNVLDKLKLNNIQNYKTEEIYELVGTSYASHYARMITNNEDIYFNVNWDIANSAFDIAIISQEEFEYYINKTIQKEDVTSEEKVIERNQNNSIVYKYLTEDDVAEKYFLDYIENAVNFKTEAYNSLNEKYREARFGNLQNFNQYVEGNTEIKDLYNSKNTEISDYENYMEYLVSRKDVGLEEYSKENFDGYTRYVCIDSYDNYYIFEATSPMQYTLILDTYTIDIPEFTAKYQEANNQEKVILNLNKFMLAINSKDYKYAYNTLADSFKTKNFPTLESFENYMKNNFFEKCVFDYAEFGDEANAYYTYNVKITDKSKQSEKIINKTFIMLLEEGTNFKISFNLE